jgi:hypothetical protein
MALQTSSDANPNRSLGEPLQIGQLWRWLIVAAFGVIAAWAIWHAAWWSSPRIVPDTPPSDAPAVPSLPALPSVPQSFGESN